MAVEIAIRLFAQIIIARDKVCQYPGCGTTYQLTCAHYITSRRDNTKFDEENCTTLCWFHHRHLHDNSDIHKKFFIGLWGEEKTLEIRQRANAPNVTYHSWYGSREHNKQLRTRLKELKKPVFKQLMESGMESYG